MVIEIDGSWGEGGGQILRICVALSAVTGKSVRIYNIRAKRSPPGIRPQHETAVRAVTQITDAEVKGLKVGSSELEFFPKTPKGGKFFFDAGTAASTSLILQSLIPTMAFSKEPFNVEIHGGTNNPWAPGVDYVQEVLLPTIAKMGFKGSVELIRRGFYPKGGGIVRAAVNPVGRLSPLILKEFGEIRRIYGLSYSSRLPSHIVDRMAKSANKTLQDAGYRETNIKLECSQPGDKLCAINPGCGIVLFAELSSGAIMGSDSLGEIGKPAERVGQEAAKGLCDQLRTNSPVDEHLGDQLIVYMALASGSSEIRVSELTLHTITCIYVSEQMLGTRFEVFGERGKSAAIVCEGSGLQRNTL